MCSQSSFEWRCQAQLTSLIVCLTGRQRCIFKVKINLKFHNAIMNYISMYILSFLHSTWLTIFGRPPWCLGKFQGSFLSFRSLRSNVLNFFSIIHALEWMRLFHGLKYLLFIIHSYSGKNTSTSKSHFILLSSFVNVQREITDCTVYST